MMEKPNLIPLPQAPDAESRAALAVPSILSNRFHLTGGDRFLRITFGEQILPSHPAAYHQAVVMPHAEAVQLAQMILTMVSGGGTGGSTGH